MSYARDILHDVRTRAAPDDGDLREARARRDAVLAHAKGYPGVRDVYVSGSIAHGTANEVRDADCGVVLGRHVFPELGPDGDGAGPTDVVEGMRKHLRESALADQYPEIRFHVQDRAIKIFFNEPFGDDCDPMVDLIVGLERAGQPGLWIPKAMLSSRPGWDASHPQKHTELFLPNDMDLRRTRVWATRLGKLWNDRFQEWSFSSFNIAALAYWGIDGPAQIGQALYDLFTYAAKDLDEHLTEDPAQVSDPIKLPDATTRTKAVARLERARDLTEEAMEADTLDEARSALARLLPDHVDPPDSDKAGRLAAALRDGGAPGVGSAGLTAGASRSRELKGVRSHGGRRGV